jgi:lipoprotein-anchoring transpeptidase ErfK/SrfK
MSNEKINRRGFLKLAAVGVGGYTMRPLERLLALQTFPASDHLARVVVGRVDLKMRPDVDSETVGVLYEDSVIPWLREVVGRNPYRFVQRYVETPEGYIWSRDLQRVRNLPNSNPLATLPDYGDGPGLWVEVSVPYVDLVLANPPVRSPAFREGVPQRLYYEQVVWVDDIRKDDDGQAWYRINERYGSYGDIFWAPAEALRPIAPEEIAPISPDVEEKRVVVDVRRNVQTLSCYEGSREVYFCRISAGKEYDAEGKFIGRSSTPLGPHPTWRKLMSIHMSGGASGVGWDLVGVAWTTFFASPGIAIHGTFWHNNFGGEYESRGCVNALPKDAQWIFRWTQPSVPYDKGDVTISMPGGTIVEVVGG